MPSKFTYAGCIDPEEHAADAMNRLAEAVVDVDEEGQRLLALVKFAREAVANSMTSGMGYKQLGVSLKDMQSLRELTTMFEKVSRSVNTLDKTADLRSKKLTKPQYLDMAKKLVLSLDMAERTRWVKEIVAKHNALVDVTKGGPGAGFNGANKVPLENVATPAGEPGD